MRAKPRAVARPGWHTGVMALRRSYRKFCNFMCTCCNGKRKETIEIRKIREIAAKAKRRREERRTEISSGDARTPKSGEVRWDPHGLCGRRTKRYTHSHSSLWHGTQSQNTVTERHTGDASRAHAHALDPYKCAALECHANTGAGSHRSHSTQYATHPDESRETKCATQHPPMRRSIMGA